MAKNTAKITSAKRQLPTPNDNVLAGLWCPSCGSYGPFEIEAKAWFKVFDDGTEFTYSDVVWENDSGCSCQCCHHRATIANFRTPEALGMGGGLKTWDLGTVIWIWQYTGMDEARGVSAKVVDEFCPSCTKKSLVRWRGADGDEYESCLNGCCPQLSQRLGPIG